MQSDDTRRHVMSVMLRVLFFVYLALRKPRVSESKGNLFALPSESGFAKQSNV